MSRIYRGYAIILGEDGRHHACVASELLARINEVQS